MPIDLTEDCVSGILDAVEKARVHGSFCASFTMHTTRYNAFMFDRTFDKTVADKVRDRCPEVMSVQRWRTNPITRGITFTTWFRPAFTPLALCPRN